jgi:hypothetical protein
MSDKKLVERLLARGTDDAGCLVWQGCSCNGHPAYRIGGRIQLVRRTLFTELVGPLDGRIVRMTCGTKGCITPKHIEAISRTAFAHEMGALGKMSGPVRSASIQRAHRARPEAKLTQAGVDRIRLGTETATALAKALGVGAGHIRKVMAGTVHRDYAASPWSGLGARA